MTTWSSGRGSGTICHIRHWIRLWDPGGFWFQSEFLIRPICGIPIQSWNWLGDLVLYGYWIEDPALWYLFERGRLPTWPCSYTLGRFRFSGGRVISVLRQFDFRHFVRWICMVSHITAYKNYYMTELSSVKQQLRAFTFTLVPCYFRCIVLHLCLVCFCFCFMHPSFVLFILF